MLFAMLVFFGGCNQQESDSDGIRSGINQHLTSLKTLNLSAMDMNVQNVSIQGDQAQAQVEFRPKTGAPQGAGMQVSYKLAKARRQVGRAKQPARRRSDRASRARPKSSPEFGVDVIDHRCPTSGIS